MPKLNLDERHARQVAAVATFMGAYGRRKRSGGSDSNDRQYDRKMERRLTRMAPEKLDALLHDDDARSATRT